MSDSSSRSCATALGSRIRVGYRARGFEATDPFLSGGDTRHKGTLHSTKITNQQATLDLKAKEHNNHAKHCNR